MEPNLVNNLVLLAIAGCTAYTAWCSRGARSAAVETLNVAQKTEVNTNSMREALVIATGQAAHAAGKEEGRQEGAATAATLAEGKLAGAEAAK